MTRTVWSIIVIAVFAVACGSSSGRGASRARKAVDAAPAPRPAVALEVRPLKPPRARVDDRIVRWARMLAEDELSVWARGGKSIIDWTAMTRIGLATAVEASKEYAENVLAADRRFKDSLIILSGTVLAVRRDVDGTVRLELKGHGHFAEVHVRPASFLLTKLEEMKPGAELQLGCRGRGSELGSPLFDCEDVDVFLHPVRVAVIDKVDAWLNGEAKILWMMGQDWTVRELLETMWVGRYLPKAGKCLGGKKLEQACVPEIEQAKRTRKQLPKEQAATDQVAFEAFMAGK